MTTVKQANAAIDALKALRETGGLTANEQQKEAMLRFGGWGQVHRLFVPTHEAGNTLANESETFRELLAGDNALTEALKVCDTSFFTPPHIIDHLYTLLAAAGVHGGRVLEPGCGTGRIIARAPHEKLFFTGIECDPTTASIAQAVNPYSKIIVGSLEKTPLREDFFDAAIGNIPFSDARMYDIGSRFSYPAHTYFIRRTMQALKPGGIAVLITSRFTFDSHDNMLELFNVADILGAVRLPSGAFADEGTNVVADIIVLRKQARSDTRRGLPYPPRIHGYKQSVPMMTVGAGSKTANINGYWQHNPQHIAGETVVVTDQYGKPAPTVHSANPHEEISRAVMSLAKTLASMNLATVNADDDGECATENIDDTPHGTLRAVGDVIERFEGAWVPVSATPVLRGLVALRDAGRAVIERDAMAERGDTHAEVLRDVLRDKYEVFVGRFGHVHDAVRKVKIFMQDPGHYVVLALESVDVQSREVTVADMVVRRVNFPYVPPVRVKTVHDAVAVSLSECGGINVARVAGLLGVEVGQVPSMLEGIAFEDPMFPGVFVYREEYLSGRVVDKLDFARRAAVNNRRFLINVEALESVQPVALGPGDIRVSLGATWIKPSFIREFCELFSAYVRVTYDPAVGVFEMDYSKSLAGPINEFSRRSSIRAEWGTPNMDPVELVECALKGKSPVVSVVVDGKDVVNRDESLAASMKLADIQQKFESWVWEDSDRAESILRTYNERFNQVVPRAYSGEHLVFPGINEGIVLWGHQRAMIERSVTSERVMCPHPVGYGKTWTMVCTAMTLRRMGLASKPLIVVPKSILEQFAADVRRAYPLAKMLVATVNDVAGDAKREFVARCATGDWDCVLMTRETFKSLPLSEESERQYLLAQEYELQSRNNFMGNSKALARALRSLRGKIESMRSGVADKKSLTFEMMGVDYIMVDEAHAYKGLPVGSQRGALSSAGSKLAVDLHMKIEWLAERYPRKPIVGLYTGTPWTNSIIESYVWQLFLQPGDLRAAQIMNFGAWAATFVRFMTRLEISANGQTYRLKDRATEIINVPELFMMMHENVDFMGGHVSPANVPDVVRGRVVVNPSDDQLRFIDDIVTRCDELADGKPRVLKRNDRVMDDNMLLVCGDGRSAALDMELVCGSGQAPKIMAVAENVARIYHENKNVRYGNSDVAGVLQAVFCDMGVPHRDVGRSYGRLKTHLVSLGVPASRIAFIHDHDTPVKRPALFAKARSGEISVVVGSTEKMGTGTNIQDRLLAVHHMDAPWRPSDVTQREGRACRPGNLNSTVLVYTYVTEKTFDSYMWQTLERKSRINSQLVNYTVLGRSVDDIDDVTLAYGEIKALASGNPDVLRLTELKMRERRLATEKSLHVQAKHNMERELRQLSTRQVNASQAMNNMLHAVEKLESWPVATRDNVAYITRGLKTRVMPPRGNGGVIATITGAGADTSGYAKEFNIAFDASQGYLFTVTVRRSAIVHGGRTPEWHLEALQSVLNEALSGVQQRIASCRETISDTDAAMVNIHHAMYSLSDFSGEQELHEVRKAIAALEEHMEWSVSGAQEAAA